MAKHYVGHQRHIEDLKWFYTESEARQGLSSSHSALVDIATGGVCGFRDPESRVNDYLFGLGPKIGDVSRARIIRRMLQQTPQPHRDVLASAYAPLAWLGTLDERFGVGKVIEIQRRYGDLAGVALMTPAVVSGYDHHREKLQGKFPQNGKRLWERRANHWDSRIGFLVSTIVAGQGELTRKVRDQADELLQHALASYALACPHRDGVFAEGAA